MLKLPKDASSVYRQRFESRPSSELERTFFQLCRRLLDDVDRAEALYSILRERGVRSEALWQGVHGIIITRAKLRSFARVPFTKVMQFIAETETP